MGSGIGLVPAGQQAVHGQSPGLDIILQHVHSRVKMNDYPLLLQVVVRPGCILFSVLTHNASVAVPDFLCDVCGFILCSGYRVFV